jgi:hypothetical protein
MTEITTNHTAETLEDFKLTQTTWKSFPAEDAATVKKVFAVSTMMGHTFETLIQAALNSEVEGSDEAAAILESVGTVLLEEWKVRRAEVSERRSAAMKSRKAREVIVMPEAPKRKRKARSAAEDATEDATEDADTEEAPAKRARKR